MLIVLTENFRGIYDPIKKIYPGPPGCDEGTLVLVLINVGPKGLYVAIIQLYSYYFYSLNLVDTHRVHNIEL